MNQSDVQYEEVKDTHHVRIHLETGSIRRPGLIARLGGRRRMRLYRGRHTRSPRRWTRPRRISRAAARLGSTMALLLLPTLLTLLLRALLPPTHPATRPTARVCHRGHTTHRAAAANGAKRRRGEKSYQVCDAGTHAAARGDAAFVHATRPRPRDGSRW